MDGTASAGSGRYRLGTVLDIRRFHMTKLRIAFIKARWHADIVDQEAHRHAAFGRDAGRRRRGLA